MMSDTNTANLSGFPLVISTKTQGTPAKLLLRNSEGMVVQQWLIKQTKCTIGSASGCAIRCTEPGIAPYHALIVVGARQTFVRALAPKVSRSGQPFNELLLTEELNTFELAGYHFELIRESQQSRRQGEQNSPKRMKFALSKPYDANNRRPATTHEQTFGSNIASNPASVNSESRTLEDIPWVAKLIQSALEPLECQLQNLAEPLNELRSKAGRSKRRVRRTVHVKSTQSSPLSPDLLTGCPADATDLTHQPSTISDQEHTAQYQPPLADEVTDFQSIVTRQNVTLELLSEKLADVTAQLAVVEKIAKCDASDSIEKTSQEDSTQSTAIEQLQSGILAVTEAISRLQAQQQEQDQAHGKWKVDIDDQLTSIREAIEANAKSHQVVEIPPSIADSLTALQSSQVATQQELTLWKEQVGFQLDRIQQYISKVNTNSLGHQDSERNDFYAPIETSPNSAPLATAHATDSWVASPDELSNVGDSSKAWATESYGNFSTSDNGIEEVSTGPQEETFEETAQPLVNANLDSDRAYQNSSSEQFYFGTASENAEEAPFADNPMADGLPDASSGINADGSRWIDPSHAVSSNDLLSIPQQEGRLFESSDTHEELMSWNQPLLDEVDLTKLTADLPPESDSFTANSFLENARQQDEDVIAPDAKLPSWWVEEAENNERVRQLATQEQASAGANEIDESSTPGIAPIVDASNEFYGLGQSDHQAEEYESAYTPSLLRAASSYTEDVEDEEKEPEIAQDSAAADSLDTTAAADDEDGSVEDYMRKLLARMRGVPEEEVELPKPEQSAPKPPSHSLDGSRVTAGKREEVEPEPTTVNLSQEETEPFDPEKYVPRALAPEKSANLAALRDLANSTARTAISTSARQRHLSNVLMKFAIAIIGMTVTAVLISINGLALNIGLIATIAALAVALIWGYDAITSLKRLKVSDAVARSK